MIIISRKKKSKRTKRWTTKKSIEKFFFFLEMGLVFVSLLVILIFFRTVSIVRRGKDRRIISWKKIINPWVVGTIFFFVSIIFILCVIDYWFSTIFFFFWKIGQVIWEIFSKKNWQFCHQKAKKKIRLYDCCWLHSLFLTDWIELIDFVFW